ncbi:hypothetical protein OBBRIDRAFT_819654 [Obba rivulosa]|uniref:CST complex subunit STN1 n=1 Tax=Obba rivulosa TaxID=1052685 RepID=A0A8E2DK36_9APHY|nr:hypothetical protein OBBRIDRAFT_819654 [Obba rivulosa]
MSATCTKIALETATPLHPRKISRQLTGSSSSLLTPPKKLRLDPPDDTTPHASTSHANAPETVHRGNGNPAEKIEKNTAPSNADIWRWTLNRDAVAKCFVRDAMEMKESGTHDAEFFWLGRVPCRTVHLVGLLVGVLVQEKRIVYSLDDGTAVIDCIRKHTPAFNGPTKPLSSKSSKPPSSRRPYGISSSSKSSTHGSSSTSSSKYAHLPIAGPSMSSGVSPTKYGRSSCLTESTVPPKPVAWVGASVRVIGRVMKRFEDRVLMVDEIEPCLSANDEPAHWLTVLDLHRDHYFNKSLGSFVVPSPPRPAPGKRLIGQAARGRDTTVLQDALVASDTIAGSDAIIAHDLTAEPQTPSTSSAYSADSPSSRFGDPQSPHRPRLRHPARLHSRDLLANTFRIYVKDYMDRLPPPRRLARARMSSALARSRETSPTPLSRNFRGSELTLHSLGPFSSAVPPRTAPSVQRRPAARIVSEETPRATKVWSNEQTPRAASVSLLLGDAIDGGDTDGEDDEDDGKDEGMHGFTLSHLRRVPELALLARRVVDAEAKRRVRAEREQERAKGESRGLDSQVRSAKDKGKGVVRGKETNEPRGRKMKRLFCFAIRQLYDEGCIVLWDGPVRGLPRPEETVGLWKSSSSGAPASASNRHSRHPIPEEEEVLSDALPGEESYIPLTPLYLLATLEELIDTHIAQAARLRSKRRVEPMPVALAEPEGPPPGPTAEALLERLRRDERWARVGIWAVKEALQEGEKAGRVWDVGGGRWERCG